MSLLSGTVYALNCIQLYLEQVCYNSFFFADTGSVPGSAVDLANNFVSDVLPEILAIQNHGVTGVRVDTFGIQGAVDFASVATIDTVGAVSGDGLPTYAAWAFRLNRTDRRMRNGYKRFVGVSESSQVNGVRAAGFDVTLDALAADLFSGISGSDGAVYSICLQQVRKNHLPVIPNNYWECGGVEYVNISTQNTRKIGRGI